MAYQYIFGPVPSRRLGVSLGLDITPDKSCSFNCVYCECGSTDELAIERREYVPTDDILQELRHYLNDGPELDSITFSGSGEPTLHSGLGNIIAVLKDDYPHYKVTVLTNSSLLSHSDVRRDLSRADLVIPSLDAVSDRAFRLINRPNSSLSSESLIKGLSTFTNEFNGNIWLEIFLVPGVNDSDEELQLFNKALQQVRFDKIQLNTLDRPGVVDWLESASMEALESFAKRINHPVEIVARKRPRHSVTAIKADVKERILSTIRIRPCTVEDLAVSLGLHEDETVNYLNILISENKAELVRMDHAIFYRAM
jgi:wyosine [tRNA(Phe)-imidazoG37] synthetase (radical SAM superfamily)